MRNIPPNPHEKRITKEFLTERRQAERARRILSIQYRLLKSSVKGGDTQWHLSTTHDMSVIGLSFLSDVPYHIDDILELNVVMSGVLDVFKGYGRVARIEKRVSGTVYLIAVKFTDRDGPSKKRKPASPPKSRTKKRQ